MCGVGKKLREVEDAGRTEGGGCCAVKALTCSKREAKSRCSSGDSSGTAAGESPPAEAD